MAEGPAYLKSKAAKYALGMHRGILPSKGVEDGEENAELAKGLSLEPTPTTRSMKMKKHLGRFWCCYLIGNIIFLAIFLPIFFLICIPAISQRVVDDSTLMLLNATIMKPHADSIVLGLASAINLPVSLSVGINAFSLDLMVRDFPAENTTYAKAYIPKSTIQGNTTLIEEPRRTPLNLPVWEEYVHRVMFEETVPLSVKGTTVAHLGKLHSKVTLNKNLPLPGLNQFKGFAIDDAQLLLDPKPDGTNLLANATLPNKSVFTLEIGQTILDVYSGDLLLGNATIDHLVLTPGTHNYPIHGMLDLQKLFHNLIPILKQQREHIRNGYLQLKTIGKSVTYNGHPVEYYQNPLQKLTLTANVPLGGLLVNTLHGALNQNGTNLLSGILDNGGSGGSGDGGSGVLKSLKTANALNNRDLSGLSDMLDEPEKLADELSRLV